jgi:hypothetical protein
MVLRDSWLAEGEVHVDAFVTVNLAFMALDIFLAHSANQFHDQAEYIPLWFSIFAPPVLVLGLLFRIRMGKRHIWNDLGHLIGWLSVLIGLAGVIFHLHSQFFYERTLKSLTYAAPFAAPLAYTGLGLLLIMNRMVASDDVEWALWLIALSAGGFAGNFVLCLTDHAVNGFYRPEEWIPVVSAAFATAFLAVPFIVEVTRSYLRLCAAVVGIQIIVGVAGFYFHVSASQIVQELQRSLSGAFYNLINGAPPMAPLLFPNLSLLALYALWAYSRFVPETGSAQSAPMDIPEF